MKLLEKVILFFLPSRSPGEDILSLLLDYPLLLEFPNLGKTPTLNSVSAVLIWEIQESIYNVV